MTGRGEYEISEPSAEGYNPAIVDRRMILEFAGDFLINSDSILRHQGGKWRKRRLCGRFSSFERGVNLNAWLRRNRYLLQEDAREHDYLKGCSSPYEFVQHPRKRAGHA